MPVDDKDEERTFETIQLESIPLIEPSKQDTEPQSSEENEESTSVKAKKSTGRKPLVKVKDEGAKVNEEIEKKSSPNLKTDEVTALLLLIFLVLACWHFYTLCYNYISWLMMAEYTSWVSSDPYSCENT
ncbi:Hypothetical predicted protein [Pelobates cultripes]|uniref:Uncharacterized protein n=1 Tax=Pelobates cultripes TaxID=61616 RepID=A0AAD1W5Q3_PELCU|nr:Hypothetical predicted protein [Pelobates cultripes]